MSSTMNKSVNLILRFVLPLEHISSENLQFWHYCSPTGLPNPRMWYYVFPKVLADRKMFGLSEINSFSDLICLENPGHPEISRFLIGFFRDLPTILVLNR